MKSMSKTLWPPTRTSEDRFANTRTKPLWRYGKFTRRPETHFGLNGKEAVKFAKGGTRIHVDMLKLRTMEYLKSCEGQLPAFPLASRVFWHLLLRDCSAHVRACSQESEKRSATTYLTCLQENQCFP